MERLKTTLDSSIVFTTMMPSFKNPGSIFQTGCFTLTAVPQWIESVTVICSRTSTKSMKVHQQEHTQDLYGAITRAFLISCHCLMSCNPITSPWTLTYPIASSCTEILVTESHSHLKTRVYIYMPWSQVKQWRAFGLWSPPSLSRQTNIQSEHMSRSSQLGAPKHHHASWLMGLMDTTTNHLKNCPIYKVDIEVTEDQIWEI